MKKIVLFFTCLLIVSNVCAWEYTTDRFVISDLTVYPGGEEAEFTVSLEGSRIYTAYNLDIHLPEGMEINYYEGEPDVYRTGSLYPQKRGEYQHTLDFSYGVVGPRWLRLACSSNTNANLLGMSGELFTVVVKVSPYMKPGEAKITIDGQNLTMSENAAKFVPYDYEKTIAVANTSKVKVNVNAENKWSTCVLPFDAAVPSGVTAYSCTSTNGDNLVLSANETMSAYTPYILYAPTGYSGELSGEVEPSKYVEIATAGLLSGAIIPQIVTDGYVLQNQGDGAMFYAVNGQRFSIPEGRCWLTADVSLGKAFYGFMEETAGITVTSNIANDYIYYNLQGLKVKDPATLRVYICNGKKIVVR